MLGKLSLQRRRATYILAYNWPMGPAPEVLRKANLNQDTPWFSAVVCVVKIPLLGNLLKIRESLLYSAKEHSHWLELGGSAALGSVGVLPG